MNEWSGSFLRVHAHTVPKFLGYLRYMRHGVEI